MYLNLVAFPSPTGSEGHLAKYVYHILRSWDLPAQLQEVERDRPNVLLFPDADLIVNSHLDTVRILAPFSSEGGYVYGTGAVDAKPGVAMMLALARDYGLRLREMGVGLAFMVDEEGDGRGSEAFVSEYAPSFGITLEPTDMRACTVEAGSVEVEVAVRARRVHGAVPWEGGDSLGEFLRLLSRVRRKGYMRARHDLLGPPHALVLRLEAGDGVYSTPEETRALLEVKILPGTDVNDVIRDLEGIFGELRIRDVSRPFENPHSRLLGLFLSEGVREGGMDSWTDAESLFSVGADVVVFGPGRLALAHSREERLNVQELLRAYRILKRVIEAYSEGKL